MIQYNPVPILFSMGSIKIHSWGVMLAIAFLLALIFMLKDAKKQKINSRHIWNLWFLCLIGGIIGSRILYVLLNAKHYLANPLEILQIWQGGMASYGGVALAIILVLFYIKNKKLDAIKITNLMAPYIALGFAVGRIGCFLNWDDFGIQSSLPWAISAFGDFPRHPTQLYLSALDFLLFFGLKKINRIKKTLKNKTPKFLKFPTLAIFLFLFAIIRLAIEPLRVYDIQNYKLISTVIFSAIILGLFCLMLIKKTRKRKKS
jgi:phosphatidylglycerol:prolipoprotein diacylglycerol transferase